MARVLFLHGPGDLRYEDRPLRPVGPGEVALRTRLGAISAGTEGAWYFGTDPQLDPSFRPGRLGPGSFPKTLGYEKLAEVTSCVWPLSVNISCPVWASQRMVV